LVAKSKLPVQEVPGECLLAAEGLKEVIVIGVQAAAAGQ